MKSGEPAAALAFLSGPVTVFISGKSGSSASCGSIVSMKRLTTPRAGRPEKARVIRVALPSEASNAARCGAGTPDSAQVRVAWGGANGNFELNVMMPMMARNLGESISLLAAACRLMAEKCVDGIEADAERARHLLEKNVIVVTALNPHIGYDNGSVVAKEAFATGRTVREVVLEKGLMTAEEIDKALDLKRMTQGGVG